jgi:hypothetical protein
MKDADPTFDLAGAIEELSSLEMEQATYQALALMRCMTYIALGEGENPFGGNDEASFGAIELEHETNKRLVRAYNRQRFAIRTMREALEGTNSSGEPEGGLTSPSETVGGCVRLAQDAPEDASAADTPPESPEGVLGGSGLEDERRQS